MKEQWEVATRVDEVHDLLCACDAHMATTAQPAPVRNRSTTAARVAQRAIHLLRQDGAPAAMFTFTLDPPFDASVAAWPPARKPAYVSRMAVTPALLESGTILGLRCYKRAFELAADQDVDVVRLEANPELSRIGELLRKLGFERAGNRTGEDGLKRVYLYRNLV